MREVDLSHYERVPPQHQPVMPGGPAQFPPNPNPMLRCPLPPTNAGSDSLRQYYVHGAVPQTRVLAPPVLF